MDKFWLGLGRRTSSLRCGTEIIAEFCVSDEEARVIVNALNEYEKIVTGGVSATAYAASVLVTKWDPWKQAFLANNIPVFIPKANSKEEAVGIAFGIGKEECPQSEGWSSPNVSVVEVHLTVKGDGKASVQ